MGYLTDWNVFYFWPPYICNGPTSLARGKQCEKSLVGSNRVVDVWELARDAAEKKACLMSHRDLKSLAGILAIRDELEPTIRKLISTFRGWAIFLCRVISCNYGVNWTMCGLISNGNLCRYVWVANWYHLLRIYK